MLYAGSSFLKWNTPPARIHKSVGHSEWIQSDITIWTQLEFQLNIHSRYSNWSVSEDVKQRAQNYLQFSCTEQFEEVLLAWMRTVLQQISEIDCQPSTGKNGRRTSYWHQSVGFQLVILSCWLVLIRVWITVASTLPSDSEHMLQKKPAI